MICSHRGHLPAFLRRWLEARQDRALASWSALWDDDVHPADPTPPANPYPPAPHPIHDPLGLREFDPLGFGEDAAFQVLKADLERSQQRTPEDKAAQAETRRRAFGVES